MTRGIRSAPWNLLVFCVVVQSNDANEFNRRPLGNLLLAEEVVNLFFSAVG